MRRSSSAALAGLLFLAGCNLSIDASRELEPGLARRIAQKQAELASKPGDAQIQVELGELYLEAERFFDAADTFRAAQAAGADTAQLHGGLAQAYMELDYMQSCMEELRTCYQKSRDEPGCLFVLGFLTQDSSDPRGLAEAQRAFTRLLEVAPKFRKAQLVSSSLDQINARLASMPPPNNPASQPAAQPAEGGMPAGHPPTGGAEAAGSAQGMPAGHPPTDGAPAVPTPGHAGGVDPDTGKEVGGLNPFGQAIMRALDAVRANDAPAAERGFTDALKIRPDDPAALAGLAEAQLAQGKQAEAVKNIEKAWTVDPKDPQVRWAFGRIMLDARKRTDEAIQAWKDLLREEPDYAQQLEIPQRLEQVEKFKADPTQGAK